MTVEMNTTTKSCRSLKSWILTLTKKHIHVPLNMKLKLKLTSILWCKQNIMFADGFVSSMSDLCHNDTVHTISRSSLKTHNKHFKNCVTFDMMKFCVLRRLFDISEGKVLYL